MSDEQAIKQITVKYGFDQYLIRLIHEVSKRPTTEIVVFFYELSEQVAKIGAEAAVKAGNRYMRKKIVDYFPGTNVPFCMFVTGRQKVAYQKGAHGNYTTYDGDFDCDVLIDFPEHLVSVSEKDLSAASVALMEQALLEAPQDDTILPSFPLLKPKTPPMYRALINAFLGRKPEKGKSRKRKDDETVPPRQG
jgi:hypothetical protein